MCSPRGRVEVCDLVRLNVELCIQDVEPFNCGWSLVYKIALGYCLVIRYGSMISCVVMITFRDSG